MGALQADLVLEGGTVVTMDDDGSVLPCADVAIRDGRIVGMGMALAVEAAEEIDVRGCAVLPGFVNAHTHETLLRGHCEDRPLHRWLEEICFPMEHALRPEHTRAAALMNQIEMIRGGTTTFVDMYRHCDVAAEVTIASGLRGIFAPQVMEIGSGRGETEAEAECFLRAWRARDHERVRLAIGPHAPYSVTGEGYRRMAELANELDLQIHTHLAETSAEVAMITEREGVGPVAWLDALGVLGPRLVCAHGVALDDHDRALLAERGAALVYNPSSNLKLASGVADVIGAIRAGVRVALGTDSVLSNNKLDMLQELRLGAILQKGTSGDATVFPAAEALRLATRAGAEVLGLGNEIGTLELGKQADIAVVDLSAPHLWPLLEDLDESNAVSQLVYAANAADVRHTIVGGTVLMRDRELLTLDVEEARAIVHAQARDLLRSLGNRRGNGSGLKEGWHAYEHRLHKATSVPPRRETRT